MVPYTKYDVHHILCYSALMNSPMISKKEQSRQRIIEAASKAMRRSGFDDVGVADVMRDAGLTHGGFYAHFASRDALLADAMLHASADSSRLIQSHVKAMVAGGFSPFRSFVEAYLSAEQIMDCEYGCPVAGLCSEMPHQVPEVRASSQQAVQNLYRLVGDVLPEGFGADSAWVIAGALIGALQLARTLGDNSRGHAVLQATKADLIARFDVSSG